MPIIQNIVALGNSPASAVAIAGGNYLAGALTATGTTQATALILSAASYIGTTAAGTGVTFQGNTQQGDSTIIANGGANALLVYPNPNTGPTEVITNLAIGTGFSIPANKSAKFTKVTSLIWSVILSA